MPGKWTDIKEGAGAGRHTSIHADQNRIGAFIVSKQAIINSFFAAMQVDLVLVECKIVTVIGLLAKMFQEDSRIM